MLRVSNLSVTYGTRRILNGIDLQIQRGEVLSIVGESGTGKTTLGLSLMGLLKEQAEDVETNGEVYLQERDITKCSEEELRKIRWNRIAMVFQNVENALNPVYTVLDQVKEPLMENKSWDKEEATLKSLDLLQKVDFPSHRLNAYPHELSAGEKQKALIAMAFVCDPDLVILDEPTASLDVASRQSILERLRLLCRDRAVLLITHNLAVAGGFSHKTAVLYGGYIVEFAPTKDLLSQPRHPYARGLLRSYVGMDRAKDLQGIKGRVQFVEKGCPFHPRCTQAIALCEDESPKLVSLGERSVACHRGGIVPLLEVKALTFSVGPLRLIDSISQIVFEGETLAIVGASGAGKTTLAKTIMGLLNSTEGEVLLEGDKVERRDKDFFSRVQMIYQDPREALSHRLKVLECVREPLDIQSVGTNKQVRYERVKAVLEEVELPTEDEFLQRYPHQLSGGEVQRVAIARALVLNPKLLIADEPTSALDASVQAKIVKLLNNIQEKRGLAILFITHDIALARKMSDRIAIMHAGRIIEEGPTGWMLSSCSHPQTRELLKAATTIERLRDSSDES